MNASTDQHMLLRRAVFHKDAATVRQLLDQGADLHAHNNRVLREGCGCFDENVLQILLDHGADPTALDGEALWIACENNTPQKDKCLKMLLEAAVFSASALEKAMFSALRNKRMHATIALLHAGLNPNAHNGLVMTTAASLGWIPVLRLLLDKGVDPRQNDSAALVQASFCRQQEALDLLYPHSDPVIALERLKDTQDGKAQELLQQRITAQQLHTTLKENVPVPTEHPSPSKKM